MHSSTVACRKLAAQNTGSRKSTPPGWHGYQSLAHLYLSISPSSLALLSPPLSISLFSLLHEDSILKYSNWML